MLAELKESAMKGVMKVISHPKVGEILSSQKFQEIVSKGFDFGNRVSESFKGAGDDIKAVNVGALFDRVKNVLKGA